ncbi:hypothetical protein C7T94_10650 [Pedobacter yulinensis]|uniref:Uncharacterized protein n=1 Tax=Pedobacter yulinensis TaxID=2126353 RepID=A0A2T3HKX7_9SPHI|nr:hypothetical protein C7T94_10650 [Pedobacter yulinensis]
MDPAYTEPKIKTGAPKRNQEPGTRNKDQGAYPSAVHTIMSFRAKAKNLFVSPLLIPEPQLDCLAGKPRGEESPAAVIQL